MLNPVQIASKGNRRQRRWAARVMGIPLNAYPATMQPVDLGIQKYKMLTNKTNGAIFL